MVIKLIAITVCANVDIIVGIIKYYLTIWVDAAKSKPSPFFKNSFRG